MCANIPHAKKMMRSFYKYCESDEPLNKLLEYDQNIEELYTKLINLKKESAFFQYMIYFCGDNFYDNEGNKLSSNFPQDIQKMFDKSAKLSPDEFRLLWNKLMKWRESILEKLREYMFDALIPEDLQIQKYRHVINTLRNFSVRQFDDFTVLTTNYDLLLDRCNSFEWVDGFVFDGKNKLSKIWHNLWGSHPDHAYLLKIHGSINWQYRKNRLTIEKVSGVEERTKDRDVIIPPTLDDKDYTNTPFKELFKKFKEIIEATDLLVVIGYSFKDEQIKNIIKKQNRNGKLTVLVLSPDAVTQTLATFG